MFNTFLVAAGGLGPPVDLINKTYHSGVKWYEIIALIIVALLCIAWIWGLIQKITTKKRDDKNDKNSSDKSDE